MMDDASLRRRFAPNAAAVPADRSTCPTPEALAASADRTDASGDRMAVLEHVTTCALCRTEFDLLRTVAATHFAPARASRPLILGAALGTAASLALFFLWPNRPAEPVLRDSGPTLALHAPVIDTVGILLAWAPVPGVDHYAIEVFTLGGDSVALLETRDTLFHYSSTSGAADSTLRWMLRAYLADGRVRESAPARLRQTQ